MYLLTSLSRIFKMKDVKDFSLIPSHRFLLYSLEYFPVLHLRTCKVHLPNSKLYHGNYFLTNDLYFYILKTRRGAGKVVEKENWKVLLICRS